MRSKVGEILLNNWRHIVKQWAVLGTVKRHVPLDEPAWVASPALTDSVAMRNSVFCKWSELCNDWSSQRNNSSLCCHFLTIVNTQGYDGRGCPLWTCFVFVKKKEKKHIYTKWHWKLQRNMCLVIPTVCLSNNTNIIIKNEVTLISCDCNIWLFRLGSNGCANNYWVSDVQKMKEWSQNILIQRRHMAIRTVTNNVFGSV